MDTVAGQVAPAASGDNQAQNPTPVDTTAQSVPNSSETNPVVPVGASPQQQVSNQESVQPSTDQSTVLVENSVSSEGGVAVSAAPNSPNPNVVPQPPAAVIDEPQQTDNAIPEVSPPETTATQNVSVQVPPLQAVPASVPVDNKAQNPAAAIQSQDVPLVIDVTAPQGQGDFSNPFAKPLDLSVGLEKQPDGPSVATIAPVQVQPAPQSPLQPVESPPTVPSNLTEIVKSEAGGAGGLINSGVVVPEGGMGEFIQKVASSEVKVEVKGPIQKPDPVESKPAEVTDVQDNQPLDMTVPLVNQQKSVPAVDISELVKEQTAPDSTNSGVNPISLTNEAPKEESSQKFEMDQSHPLKDLYSELAQSQKQSDELIKQEIEAERRHETIDSVQSEQAAWQMMSKGGAILMMASWLVAFIFFFLPLFLHGLGEERRSIITTIYFIGTFMVLVTCTILTIWIKIERVMKFITWGVSFLFTLLLVLVALKSVGIIGNIPGVGIFINMIVF